MIRINLLPPEITEKRKDEKRWRWVIAAALGVLVVLVCFYLVMFYLVTVKTADVAQIEQQAQQLQVQAEQVKVFQVKQDELKQRRAIVDSALKGRVAWDEMFYEVSLVMPPDIWLQALHGEEDDPLLTEENESIVRFTGWALNSVLDTPDNGYKSIAKLMVRLAELPQLQHVWLVSGANEIPVGNQAESATEPERIGYSVEAKTPQTVLDESDTATGSPAPPSTP
jgi:Tfp pilus assembly protein PilN